MLFRALWSTWTPVLLWNSVEEGAKKCHFFHGFFFKPVRSRRRVEVLQLVCSNVLRRYRVCKLFPELHLEVQTDRSSWVKGKMEVRSQPGLWQRYLDLSCAWVTFKACYWILKCTAHSLPNVLSGWKCNMSGTRLDIASLMRFISENWFLEPLADNAWQVILEWWMPKITLDIIPKGRVGLRIGFVLSIQPVRQVFKRFVV